MVQLLNDLAAILVQGKYQANLVGGFVRDLLVGRETSDIDIAVNRDAVETAKGVAEAMSGRYVLLDRVNKVARVVMTTWEHPVYLDFSTFASSIEEDLSRRDFTIDAMAIDLRQFISASWTLIDPFKGKADLRKRRVKAVAPLVFKDDPARLLRAVRLAAELGFTIDGQTKRLLKQYAELVTLVSGERQREELLKLCALPVCGDYLRFLDEAGLLTRIIPDLEELRGVEQPREHYWDVLNHSLETVITVEFLLRERQWEYGGDDLLRVIPWTEEVKQHFDEEVSGGSNHKILLKIGALLHDIAKPQMKTVDENGRTRFIGHAKEGAVRAVGVLTKLRFSSREIELVKKLVCYHLRPVQMANVGLPTNRAIYRYFRDTGDAGIDILFLALADYLAARGPNLDVEEWEQHNHLINNILKEHQNQEHERLPRKLIDGHELMEVFCLTSGPLLGKLLRLVHEAQAVGEIKTKDEAIILVRSTLEKEGYKVGGQL